MKKSKTNFKSNAKVVFAKTTRTSKVLSWLKKHPERSIRAFDLKRLDRTTRPALKPVNGELKYEVIQSTIN